MVSVRVISLTVLAMIAFAGNSLLCRVALKETAIDPAAFTSLRLVSGAVVLWLLVVVIKRQRAVAGSWGSAFALFGYAAAFSFAYVDLSAATGALLLFGAVQATMIGHALWVGERLRVGQTAGVVIALAGMVGLMLPGLTAPPLFAASLMLSAGVAWGVYSLRGRGGGDPTVATAGNFVRSVPLVAVLAVAGMNHLSVDAAGIIYAVASGALASGIGYAIWYAALPGLQAAQAATVQLSVPVITAVGGVLFLDEMVTLRLILASAAILGGIALVIVAKDRTKSR
ncbi:DMT family transporter [Thiosocius teredinicola]|uniref:DMT family transporter n=1 Tax=Thiosocius teredinicola TaxID=1973002 RepID=UPI000990E8F9